MSVSAPTFLQSKGVLSKRDEEALACKKQRHKNLWRVGVHLAVSQPASLTLDATSLKKSL